MATNNNTSIIFCWALNATVHGSNDSYLLLNIFPNDIADNFFCPLRNEITWNEMKQEGGSVLRDMSIQGTLTIKNDDEYEPLYCHQHTETHIKFVHYIMENILLFITKLKFYKCAEALFTLISGFFILRAVFRMVATILHLDTGVRHVIRMINDYYENSARHRDDSEEDDENEN